MKNNLSVNVIDNFLPQDVHKEVYDKFISSKGWSFTGGNDLNPFWHIDKLEEDEYFNSYILSIIRQKTGIDNTYIAARIYVNGQTAGQCGYPHSDDGHLTFLYFPNLEWKIDWQGHLMFLNRISPVFNSREREDWNFIPQDSDEVSQVITYKPNRAVFFPSHIVHHADAPHRLYNWLRMSLAYKFDKL